MITPFTKQILLDLVQQLKTFIEALPDDGLPNELGRKKIQVVNSRISLALQSPQDSLAKLRFQPHQSAAARIGVEGGWFEALADGTPKTANRLASITGAQERLIGEELYTFFMLNPVWSLSDMLNHGRSLSACYESLDRHRNRLRDWSRNILSYADFPNFDPTCSSEWSETLVSFDHCAPVLIRLPQYLARNGYQVPEDPDTAPFADTWGSPTWKLYEKEPARGEIFNSYMTERKDGNSNWLDFFPFESRLGHGLNPDGVLFVDVGGGYGHVLKDFKAKCGTLPGRLLLQDLPGAIWNVNTLREEGIETMVYDFFTPQPVKGARVYYFSCILHDWPESHCRQILQNTASAMTKGYSKFLINELVLPEVGAGEFQAFMDLSMMALETGSERTAKQWHSLLDSAGLRIEKIWTSNDPDGRCIIEAVLKDEHRLLSVL